MTIEKYEKAYDLIEEIDRLEGIFESIACGGDITVGAYRIPFDDSIRNVLAECCRNEICKLQKEFENL